MLAELLTQAIEHDRRELEFATARCNLLQLGDAGDLPPGHRADRRAAEGRRRAGLGLQLTTPPESAL
jgi:hypothetical protein